MPELTLHLELGENADRNALAAVLQQEFGKLAAVSSVETPEEQTRTLGPQEIIAIIGLVTTGVQAVTGLLKAIKAMQDSWDDLTKRYPALKNIWLEVGLRRVPLHEVSAEDIDTLSTA